MNRIVLDTNVLLSAALFGGKPRLIIEAAQEGHFLICISEPIITELRDVLRRPKFRFGPEIADSFISELLVLTIYVNPERKISVIPEDPYDNHILACAIAGKAQYLVTGDSHLLHLKTYENIKIVTPDQFVKLILP